MGILATVREFFGRGGDTDAEEEQLRRAFKTRCGQFTALLAANKRALEAMAELEQALKDERLFTMSFVREGCETVTRSVREMVERLTLLCPHAPASHAGLLAKWDEIQRRIAVILSPPKACAWGPLVLPLERVDRSLADEAGGKMAALGEIAKQPGLRVPRGFVVTAGGYQRFLEANALQEEIHSRMRQTDPFDLEAVFALSEAVRAMILAAPLPEELAAAILGQYARLDGGSGALRLAVRSSAVGEDALSVSFAGQYLTLLNVGGEKLLDSYKQVVASQYGVTAMSYRISHGIADTDTPMCVGCLEMVDSRAGGVAYSRDPFAGEGGDLLVNAVFGLPGGVVDGSTEVDLFRVSRGPSPAVTRRQVARKRAALALAPDGGVRETPLEESRAAESSLTDEEILRVASAALQLERAFGHAQDVEWAIDRRGELLILQSRDLADAREEAKDASLPEGTRVLLEGGVAAAPGVGAGEVRIVRTDADMLRFPPGAVLVVEQAHARWAPLVSTAAAVVAEYGGLAGHLASVAREYGVPALFSVHDATRVLQNDARRVLGDDAIHSVQEGEVTVDADARRLLAGRVDALLFRTGNPKHSFFASPVHAALAKAAEHIVPLRLLDPASPEFAPAFCRSMHDITRYCHEKAVEAMFRTDDTPLGKAWGKQLTYKGSRLQYFVINLDRGFRGPVTGRYVSMEEICCPPMRALWEGMLAVPWTGPPVPGARGLLSVIAQSAANPELEVTSAATRMTRNYFLIDHDYCNLQASFGYHFCTVEARAGEGENYVTFHFKGGAANLARKRLRLEALADVLSENGFITQLKEDALFARAEELSAEEALELLAILGYLLIHTRQMDAALGNEASRAAFADTLRKGIGQVLRDLSV